MKVYFISDNSFFLLGIEETIVKKGDYDYRLINTNNGLGGFYPIYGDIIIVSIKNLHLRERIMRMPILKNCRVMLMLSVPVRSSSRRHYPWLIRKDIKSSELTLFINKAKKISTCLDVTSQKVRDIFQLLGNGSGMEELSSDSRLSAKHLYQVKRTIIKRYGLYQCNSLGVLICRDIIYATLNRG